jgi:mutator protein MutT
MSKIRSAAIVLKDNHILLMHRKNNVWVNDQGVTETREYWVFPGGTVEQGETPEEAVVREVFEETTLQVSIDKLLYSILFTDTQYQHYFYLCDYLSGIPAIHKDSPEAQKIKDGTQWYEPMWFPLNDIPSLVLYPHEIRDTLLGDINDSFSKNPRHAAFSSESDRNAKPNYF